VLDRSKQYGFNRDEVRPMRPENIITVEKLVLAAAQSVWAKNKYLVLACSQQDYLAVRKLLRTEHLDLTAVYNIFNKIESTYCTVPTEALPQVSNALFHIAGYFKKFISAEERREIDHLIQTNPGQALALLEENTRRHHIPYLLQSRFWSHDREKPFNLVPMAIVHENVTYQANELMWHGDYLSLIGKPEN